MKTHSFINKIFGLASMAASGFSGIMEAIVNEIRATVDEPVIRPRSVRVPVRVWRSEFSDPRNF